MCTYWKPLISDPSYEGMTGNHLGSGIGIYRDNHIFFLINVSRERFDPLLAKCTDLQKDKSDALTNQATTAGSCHCL